MLFYFSCRNEPYFNSQRVFGVRFRCRHAARKTGSFMRTGRSMIDDRRGGTAVQGALTITRFAVCGSPKTTRTRVHENISPEDRDRTA